jgi:putative endopeptidase
MRHGLKPPLSCLMLLTVVATAASAPPPPTPAPHAAIGAFGLDLAGGDPTVKPGEDFYRYAGGTWLKTEQIPADRANWGTLTKLRSLSQERVRDLIEAAATSDARDGSVQRKVGDYYAAYLDTKSIEARGLAPAMPGLAAIASARSHEDIARLLARADLGLPSPIDFGISLDRKNPDRYVVVIRHGGIALPERDFYLREDEQFTTVRAQYREHIARFMKLAGQDAPEESAAAILALETEIARLHWPAADRRDSDRTYNLVSRAGLDELAPDFPWAATFDAAGLPPLQEVVVGEKSAIPLLAKLFHATPVATWRRYLTYHFLRTHASLLPTALDAEAFAFFGHTLNGQPEQTARWKRAVDATNGGLGEAVGQLYVARYFPPAAKAAALEMIENLRAAFADRIAHATWMSEETRKVAADKLAAFRPKIGYPDRWRDYSGVEVRRDDAFGNHDRSVLFEWRRELGRLSQKTDRDEWFLAPQTVNAYYNPIFNEIVFPAAILQPPLFDAAADSAVNYGAIGGVIGHEMGHGFDDQGAKYDAHGVLRSWWLERDVTAFKALGDRLAVQYDAYEPLPGIRVNGRLTLGENLGDLGGTSVALEAYHRSLQGRPAPVIGSLGGDQRFFLAWAQAWRSLYRDQSLRNQVLSDPHSPGPYRVNGVVRNMDAWYDAFDVKPDDALYLSPPERVRVW